MKKVELYMVRDTAHSECDKKGNNKFYFMEQISPSEFRATYGRVGTNGQTKVYPMSKWYSTYDSKIGKGYVDNTSYCPSTIAPSPKTENVMAEFKAIRTKAVREIVEKLMNAANAVCRREYRNADIISVEMVSNAQSLLDDLSFCQNDLSDFNEKLMRLMTFIPRSMSCVDDYLAKVPTDKPKIIMREQNLLDALRSKVTANKIQQTTISAEAKDQTILDALGIKVTNASAKDVDVIKDKLGDSRSRFVRAWKVVNKKTAANFKKYLKTAPDKKTELLWHGSDTCNWWNILQQGLKLRPSTSTFHGKMFGSGLYFAPRAKKSIGYTSVQGSYWQNGQDSCGYLALFDVAVGKSYYCDDAQPNMSLRGIKSKGCDSLWAKAGRSLRNDEVIVYTEEQATISYLVEVA